MSEYSRRKKTLKERIRVCRKARNVDNPLFKNKMSDIHAVIRSNFVAADCPKPPARKRVHRVKAARLSVISPDSLLRIEAQQARREARIARRSATK